MISDLTRYWTKGKGRQEECPKAEEYLRVDCTFKISFTSLTIST